MSWCDRLASVPGAGFRLDTHFASSDAILDALSPVLNPLFKAEKAQFTITKQQSFEVDFTTEHGFNYSIEPTKISVTFKHRMRARPVSSGPPVMEMLSQALPYTELLPIVSKRLIEATLLVPGAKTRSVTRVGIISTTAVADDEVPPGVARFIEYLGRPWGGSIDHFSLSITAEVGKGQGWSDRCIHTLLRPEDKDELMTLTFDWQRLFTTGHPVTSTALIDILEKGEKAALRYFEDLAEGKRFDEKLIREAAGV